MNLKFICLVALMFASWNSQAEAPIDSTAKPI
jgi:hypothetical protein